jgi:RNA 2',3'-cyclic 3'-phosphodiesterase
MNPEDENLRIFLGLPIEAQDGDELRARFQLASAHTRDDLAWLDPRKYHVTIRFLAQFPRASLPPLIESLGKLVLPQLNLMVLQISDFPKPGGHSLVANLRLSTELAKVFYQISEVLDSFGFKFENHSFRPHITLAKIKKNQKNIPLEKVVLKNYEIKVDELVLYQSHLNDPSSLYISLHTFKLV